MDVHRCSLIPGEPGGGWGGPKWCTYALSSCSNQERKLGDGLGACQPSQCVHGKGRREPKKHVSRGRETHPWPDRTAVVHKKTCRRTAQTTAGSASYVGVWVKLWVGISFDFCPSFKAPHLPLHWLSRGGVVRRRLVDPTRIATNGTGSQRRQYACCPSAKRMSRIVYFPTSQPPCREEYLFWRQKQKFESFNKILLAGMQYSFLKAIGGSVARNQTDTLHVVFGPRQLVI